MSEWLKEHAWKACVGETLPWVRIPLSPPCLRYFVRQNLYRCTSVPKFDPKCSRSSAHWALSGRKRNPTTRSVRQLVAFRSSPAALAHAVKDTVKDKAEAACFRSDRFALRELMGSVVCIRKRLIRNQQVTRSSRVAGSSPVSYLRLFRMFAEFPFCPCLLIGLLIRRTIHLRAWQHRTLHRIPRSTFAPDVAHRARSQTAARW